MSYAGDTKSNGTSARNLMAPALPDEMRLQLPVAPRVVTLSLKDYTATMLAGRRADAATWFDSEARGWATSTGFTPAPVPCVRDFIAANPIDLALDEVWRKSLPDTAYRHEDDGTGEKGAAAVDVHFPAPAEGRERPGRCAVLRGVAKQPVLGRLPREDGRSGGGLDEAGTGRGNGLPRHQLLGARPGGSRLRPAQPRGAGPAGPARSNARLAARSPRSARRPGTLRARADGRPRRGADPRAGAGSGPAGRAAGNRGPLRSHRQGAGADARPGLARGASQLHRPLLPAGRVGEAPREPGSAVRGNGRRAVDAGDRARATCRRAGERHAPARPDRARGRAQLLPRPQRRPHHRPPALLFLAIHFFFFLYVCLAQSYCSQNARKFNSESQINSDYLYTRFAEFFRPDDVVLADSSTSFFGLLPIFLPKGAKFESQMLWGAIGWATPATFRSRHGCTG